MPGKISVVLADDSIVERSQLTRILTADAPCDECEGESLGSAAHAAYENLGHSYSSPYVVVAQCADAEQAVKSVLKLKPDVVILDVVMPRLSGDAAALEIWKKVHPCPAMVFATKNTQLALQQIAEKVGAELVGKPYQPSTVLQKVAKAYDGRRR